MLTNDLLKRHMFKFIVIRLTNRQRITKKSLFYANEQHANELICICIQLFKTSVSSLFM